MPDHFTLHEVVPGVHAAVAGDSGAAVGNAAIIDCGEKTLVFDTFFTAQAADELRAEAIRLTGHSAFLVVNSHWHGDHTRGNQVFADAPIASTARTVELMIADAPADLGAYEAEIDGALASFREKLESDDETERRLAGRRIAGLEQLKESIPGFRLTLPDLQFEDRLVIEGERRVELLTHGKGHTDSDVFAWLPGERTLVAGDLCWNAIHPRSRDGHPDEWADTLEKILLLEPDRVIPGHGRPDDDGMVRQLIPYFRAVSEMVAQVRAGAASDGLDPPDGTNDWEGAERMRDGVSVIAAR